jgi:hypothetical protein
MHSEPATENRAAAAPVAAVRGRRRKPGNASADGPVFVDNSGRRSKVLRRIGLLLGVVCVGYAVVLGMAFMGIGTSINPSSLVPFGGQNAGPSGRNGPGGYQPQGGPGTRLGGPSGTPSTASTDTSAPSSSASAAAAAN